MTRHFASDAEIARIGEGLLVRTLPKPEWTHAAHFAATLWLLRHRPEIDLPQEMPDIIRGYNVSVGGVNSDSEGYHETITQASLHAARAFLGPRSEPLHVVLDDLMASRLGDKNWLLDHWSKDSLFSVAARRKWVESDIQPLAF